MVTWTTNGVVTVPTVQLAAVPSPRTTPLGSETIAFNEAVTGFDVSDLKLTLNGGPNLLTINQTLTTTNNTTFTLTNLTGITTAVGTYVLTLTANGSGIASGGTALTTGAGKLDHHHRHGRTYRFDYRNCHPVVRRRCQTIPLSSTRP